MRGIERVYGNECDRQDMVIRNRGHGIGGGVAKYTDTIYHL